MMRIPSVALAALFLCLTVAQAQFGDPGHCFLLHKQRTRALVHRPFLGNYHEFENYRGVVSMLHRSGQGNSIKWDSVRDNTQFKAEKTQDALRIGVHDLWRKEGAGQASTILDFKSANGLPVELRLARPESLLAAGTYDYTRYEHVDQGPAKGSVSLLARSRFESGVERNLGRQTFLYRPDGFIGEKLADTSDGTPTLRYTWVAQGFGERMTEWVWDTVANVPGWRADKFEDWHFDAGGRLTSWRMTDLDDGTGLAGVMNRDDYRYDAEGRLLDGVTYSPGGSLDSSKIMIRFRFNYDAATGLAEESAKREDADDTSWSSAVRWGYKFDKSCRLVEAWGYDPNDGAPYQWNAFVWDTAGVAVRPRMRNPVRPAAAQDEWDAAGRVPGPEAAAAPQYRPRYLRPR